MEDNNKDAQEEQDNKPSTDDSGDGNQSELVKQTDAANAAAERMELATQALKAEQAKARLGGVTEAGQKKEEKKEESDHDYRVRVNKEMASGKTEFGN